MEGLDVFGLGVLLDFRDQASLGMMNSARVFRELQGSAEELTESLNNTLDSLDRTAISGFMLARGGMQVLNTAGGIVDAFKNVSQAVIGTGDTFEKTRLTLKALYKDADLAESKLKQAIDLAAKTPFEVKDVTDALVGYKALGIEALDLYKNVNGESRTFLEYMGDLAALRPDVGLKGVLIGVRNLLGGDSGRSLRMRMDMDLADFTKEGEWAKDKEDIIEQLVYASTQVANGLMKELEDSWSTIFSNLDDTATKVLLGIADGGAFDAAKGSLNKIYQALVTISDEEINRAGKNIASAFSIAWKPVDLLAGALAKCIGVAKNIALYHPLLLKVAVGVTMTITALIALSGTLLVLKGVSVLITAGIKLFRYQLSKLALTMGLSATKAKHLSTTILFLGGKLLWFGALLSTSYLLWKTDFAGIRTSSTEAFNSLSEAITHARKTLASDNATIVSELNRLDKSTIFFDVLERKIIRVASVFRLVKEAWSDFTLSEDSFKFAQDTGILGIVTDILQAKRAAGEFIDGFKDGLSSVGDYVLKLGDTIAKVADFFGLFKFEEYQKQVYGISDSLKSVDTKKWNDLGGTFGKILGFLVLFKGAIMVLQTFAKLASILAPVKTVITVVLSIGTKLLGVLGTIVGAIAAIAGLPAWVVGLIIAAVVALVAFLILKKDQIKEGFNNMCEWVKDKFTESIDRIKTNVSGWVETWKTALSNIKDAVSDAVGWIGDKFESATNKVSNFFNNSFIGKGLNLGLNIATGGKLGMGLNAFSSSKSTKDSGGKVPALSTGGFIKAEGLAYLHPDEVVVNSPLTSKLDSFLSKESDGSSRITPTRYVLSDGVGSNSVVHNETSDNRIVFEKESIVIQVSGSELSQDVDNFVDKVYNKVKTRLSRDRQVQSLRTYKL